ncbi:hypothetical protein NIM87_08400 [Devosia sp. XJ19-1]|uniref:CsgH-like domain-containing protein n=1 Tax=Devosia ureilytica TaxID=2952754 RepID=A0A9Q4FSR8_9HYPH|nr:curli-like amyloid fiber formation chaperone CsgH [Devosia ureilytica]MCP8883516.1 hypothetical protein [Devosia ureilytica]MCP8887124.1 hypothetical protein [Devosia ureilytica]
MVYSSFRIGIIALGALAIAGVAAQAGSNGTAGVLDCGISTKTERGMMSVEGVLTSPVAMSGDYRFSLRSQSTGGSSNISQGGQFTVAPGTAVSLGKVLVNAGSSIDVDFTIASDGQQFNCSGPLTAHT